jgi:hypothetical protein
MTIKNLCNFICQYKPLAFTACIVRWSVCTLLVLSFVTFSTKNAFSQESNDDRTLKSELQVAMIFKMLDFIQWPPESFQISKKIFRIGVFWKSPMFDSIKILEEETIKGLQVKVELVENTNNAKNFHILYVSPKEISKISSILKTTEDAKTLTISKTAGFAKKGGILNFYEKKGKMRFEINLEKAKKAGFKISSRMLSLSKIISSE